MQEKFFQKKFWQIFIGLVFGCFTFFSISIAKEIQITEIDPTDEYIEIQNTSENTIDLQNWKYSELSGSTEKIYDISVENFSLEDGKFFIIPLSRKINDSGDTIRIYTPENIQEDEVIIPKKEDGKSWQLFENQWSWEISSKGEENFIEEKIEDQEEQEEQEEENNDEKIFLPLEISEILPNPIGTDSEGEWIEIYNPNEEIVELNSWQIKDASGKNFIFSGDSEENKIEAKQYKIFWRAQTQITISNTNEKIFLLDPNNIIHSTLEFEGSAQENFSYTPQGWTQTPTPNKENIIFLPSSSSGSTKNDDWLFEEKYFAISSPRTIPPEIIITKVSANSSLDFVEVLCRKCDMDIEGIRLGTDGEIYRIPKNTFAKTGETLRFQFQKDTTLLPKKYSKGLIFFVPFSGITSTDESIYIGDEKGQILDALCYSNRNKSFTSQERQDLGNIVYMNQWNAINTSEASCVDVSIWQYKSILSRKIDQKTKKYQDTNGKEDFYLSTTNQKFIPTDDAQLHIEKINFFDTKTQIFITNRGEKSIDSGAFFLGNKNKFISTLSEENIELFPKSTIIVSIPISKLPDQDIAISLRNQENTILDFFCANILPESKKYIPQYRQKNLWKGSCLRWTKESTENKITVGKKNFSFPLTKEDFEIRKQKREIFLSETITPQEKDDDEGRSEIDKKTYHLSIDQKKSSLTISGEIFSRPKEIIFSIPKANIKTRIRISKTGKFSHTFTQPFKKGVYRLSFRYKNYNDISNKNTKKIEHEVFTIHQKIFSDEIKSIDIIEVLPNPKGKDSGKEIITLQNKTKKSGWIRNWTVTQGTKVKPLDSIFLEPGESITLEKKNFSSLKNSGGEVIIKNSQQKVIDTVQWTKAQEGEYFGTNAPIYIPNKKPTKTATKTVKKIVITEKKEVPAPSTQLFSLIEKKGQTLFLQNNKGEIFEYILPISSKYFLNHIPPKSTAKAVIRDNIIQEIIWIKTENKKNNIQKKTYSTLIFWGIGLLGIFSCIVAIGASRRKEIL